MLLMVRMIMLVDVVVLMVVGTLDALGCWTGILLVRMILVNVLFSVLVSCCIGRLKLLLVEQFDSMRPGNVQ